MIYRRQLGEVLTDPHYPGVSVDSGACVSAQSRPNLSMMELALCSIRGYAAALPAMAAASLPGPVVLPIYTGGGLVSSPASSGGGSSGAGGGGASGSPSTLPPVYTGPTGQGPQVVPVQTATGKVDVPVDELPGTADTSLVPTMVNIPNVWDFLDPSKVSQFEYQGLARSLPPWISRRAVAAAGVPAASVVAASTNTPDGSTFPLWLVLAAGAAVVYAASRHPAVRARRRKVTR